MINHKTPWMVSVARVFPSDGAATNVADIPLGLQPGPVLFIQGAIGGAWVSLTLHIVPLGQMVFAMEPRSYPVDGAGLHLGPFRFLLFDANHLHDGTAAVPGGVGVLIILAHDEEAGDLVTDNIRQDGAVGQMDLPGCEWPDHFSVPASFFF